MRLLDSNILIYAAAPGQAELRNEILASPAAISVATMIEVLGYHKLAREEENDLRALINELILLPVDLSVAERAITLRQCRRLSLGDAIIAATALVHHLPLVTRNVDDFRHIGGLDLQNPFAPAG